MVEFLSSTLHLLPLIYPIFSCVDPILIQIQDGSTTQLSNDDLYLAGLHAELEAAQR